MNADVLKGKWGQIKGQVKKEWGDLTDQDIDLLKGKKDQFLGILQEKYGYNLDKAEKKLGEFMDKIANELDIDPQEISRFCNHYVHCMEDKMKHNVFKTAAIAFGIGLIANSLLRSLFGSSNK